MPTYVANRNRAGGSVFKRRFGVYIEGGPELAAAFRALDESVRIAAAKDVVQAMGEPIEKAWKEGLPTGPAPIHMSEAVKLRVTKAKNGANGTISARKVRGAEADEQPAAYDQTLEFGDRTRAAHPVIRPAFDQHKDEAVSAAERVLKAAIAKVTM